MQLTLEAGSRANLIRGYSDAEIRIGEHSVHRSCVVTADTLITDWEPGRYADLRPEHLATILALHPELVVIGTGTASGPAPSEIRALLAQQGVGLEVMQLGAACRTYNVLVQEQRRVAGVLFLK